MPFQKAHAEQAALKVAMYGVPGAGKTFSALLIAEGLANLAGKRIAFVDTERGTDFYCKAVPTRQAHPEAFDFDALYTRSLTEVLKECRALDQKKYGVVIIDSVTHLWDAAVAAYTGKKTRIGSIPMHAWGPIKKPYKDLMHFLLNSGLHVFLLGRQSNEFEEDEDSGEIKAVGVKMRAEKETPYEPHICIRMESVKAGKHGVSVPTAYVEKDRTGVLQGKLIEWPSFDSVAAPLLGLLGHEQAAMQSEDEASALDSEALAAAERERLALSASIASGLIATLNAARTPAELEAAGAAIGPVSKKKMTPADLESVRGAFQDAKHKMAKPASPAEPPPANGNGKPARQGPPTNGPELLHDLEQYDRALVKMQLIGPGELLKHIHGAFDRELGDDIEKWPQDRFDDVIKESKAFHGDRESRAKEEAEERAVPA